MSRLSVNTPTIWEVERVLEIRKELRKYNQFLYRCLKDGCIEGNNIKEVIREFQMVCNYSYGISKLKLLIFYYYISLPKYNMNNKAVHVFNIVSFLKDSVYLSKDTAEFEDKFINLEDGFRWIFSFRVVQSYYMKQMEEFSLRKEK